MNNKTGDGPVGGHGVDERTPSDARLWNYWLGGKDNFEIDRTVGDAIARMFPVIRDVARADREFLRRVVTQLARDVGIRQFLDVGTGLPTAENTHEVAQRIAPEARVVYVDHDPVVLSYARVLLAGTSGRTAYIDADAEHPDEILRRAAETIDFDEPIALMMLGLLCFLDDAAARHTVSTLVDSLAPGSVVVITHPTTELDGEANVAAMQFWNDNSPSQTIVARSHAEVLAFFDGLELLEPGLVSCSLWRPDDVEVGRIPVVPQWGAVGIKR